MLRKLNEFSSDYSLQTIVNGFNSISDSFISPTNSYGEKLDIVIRELNPNLIKSIGKIAFNIYNKLTPENIEFGYAVGFPEIMKCKKNLANDCFQISMPLL